ncbi:MAG: hypothetical protein HYX27_11855 [Acidobacteria bacterium]|nr:hypothetical protein [Acidobacteriota bacterium]
MRHKRICLLACSLVSLHAATVGPSEPIAWRFAHPEAQVLAGVDFRRLVETAEGKQIRDQFAAALGAPLLDQAERLLMSSVVDAGGKRSDVIILSGSFSLAQLRKMAMREGAKMMPYKGIEIAAPAGATAADPHLAWMPGPLSGTIVLIGTRPAIQAAAERSKAQVESLASVNPLFKRAQEMSPQFPVWVACDTVPRGFGPKSLDALADAEGIEGLDVGVQLSKTPDVNFWVWTGSEETAAKVLKTLQTAGGSKEQFVLSSWLPQLKGRLDGGTLVLAAPIANGSTAEKIGPLLAAFALPVDWKAADAPAPALAVRAKVEAGPAAVQPPVIVPAAAPPPPPKKLFVRIEGLDDGAKDIPYTAKQ